MEMRWSERRSQLLPIPSFPSPPVLSGGSDAYGSAADLRSSTTRLR